MDGRLNDFSLLLIVSRVYTIISGCESLAFQFSLYFQKSCSSRNSNRAFLQQRNTHSRVTVVRQSDGMH